ncbi:hypothetical protein L210DRAFT_3545076 [Boletus edulis BED1]|uniref:Secreted protein n=1 Tax=Boletus edulis BED1 TaxID=1328754 RepID=A0AAD4BS33_BOLED|nr:hypothetical protein L210DRAFT_3545076 [Boletus edulis BED1]
MLCPVLQQLFAAPSTLTCVIVVPCLAQHGYEPIQPREQQIWLPVLRRDAHVRVRVPLRVTPAHVPFLLFPDARLPECQKHVGRPHPARLYESTQ